MLITYCIAVALLSPQPVEKTNVADIRYLVALIPLGMALGVWSVLCWTKGRMLLAVGVGVLVFWTTLLQSGPWGMRSRLVMWVDELLARPIDPYRAVGEWMGDALGEGESVAVFPQHMMYPLMFMNPDVVFAWQLDKRGETVFPCASDVHFRGREAPDWFVVFGPTVVGITRAMDEWKRERGWTYSHAGTVACHWRDLHRPEVFWRNFGEEVEYDARLESVQVFRRVR